MYVQQRINMAIMIDGNIANRHKYC